VIDDGLYGLRWHVVEVELGDERAEQVAYARFPRLRCLVWQDAR
jgi:hypothetical protein